MVEIDLPEKKKEVWTVNVEILRGLMARDALRWTNHITVRLLQRQINTDDVESALLNGAIIEQYPDDYPYPSCLVLGESVNGQPLHVVCGTDGDNLWLITAYYPCQTEWMEDWKTRRRTKP